MPKREIHPAFDRRRSLWHLVNPEALSLAGHQPKSLTELKRNYIFRSPVSKLEAPRRPKRQAGDGRTITSRGFIQ